MSTKKQTLSLSTGESMELKRKFNDSSIGSSDLQKILMRDLGWQQMAVDSSAITKSIDPQVTHACDHECPHCWASIDGKHMEMDTFKNVLLLAEAAQVRTIQFSGGEPTLNKKIIEMAELAKVAGFSNTLRTHGRFLGKVFNQSNGKTWADEISQTFDEVFVSIDGLANSNFEMRPVKSGLKLIGRIYTEDSLSKLKAVAQKQFDETMTGYTTLHEAIGSHDIKLKINTVVARANVHDIFNFAQYLSSKVTEGQFRVDNWDLTQVFPSNGINSDEPFLIKDQEFLSAVGLASLDSLNISKRAKPRTWARCLVVEQDGKTYFGGGQRFELGNVNNCDVDECSEQIGKYSAFWENSHQDVQQYLVYKP